MFIEIIIFIAASIFAALVLWIILRIRLNKQGSVSEPVTIPVSPKKRIPCVLCGAVLVKGEKLHSKEIIREKDSIVHMYGCQYCHVADSSRIKKCPVCGKTLRADEYLIGRMWLKKTGKKHLHLSGCVRCAKSTHL